MGLTLPERALTVWQPWAWAIVMGHKPVENRTQRTHYRGRLGIHAALTYDEEANGFMVVEAGVDPVPHESDLTFGALIGEVTVVDCLTDAQYAEQFPDGVWGTEFAMAWKWVLTNPVAYDEPIPMRGKQGIWIVG